MSDLESILWQREHGFWMGDAEYYRRNLSEDALMVFPGMVLDRAASIEAIGAAPRWTTVTFEDQRSVVLSGEVVVLHYRATARREEFPYQALATSVYVKRDDVWRLAVHQQTP